MYSDINAKLIDIQGQLRKKEKYKGQLADYQMELEIIEERISQLEMIFEEEQEDVVRLEGFSLTNLFATLAGNKDAKLSKEKQEMLAAQHQLEEAEKTRKEIDEAMLLIADKLLKLEDAEYHYQQLLQQKEEMIKSSTSPAAGKIFELSGQEGKLKAYLTEINEARNAGYHVESALDEAIHSLEKADNWGTWDMFGGGTISGIAKHQYIDQAESYLHKAQTSMRKFQKELLDIQEDGSFEINISGMLKFADFFFDGFIADYLVQGKINRTLEQTKNHYTKVRDILIRLKEQSSLKERKLEAVQREKQLVIESL